MKRKVALIGVGVVVALLLGLAAVFHQEEARPLGKIGLAPSVAFQGGQVRLSETGLLPAEPVEIRVSEQGDGGATRNVRWAQASLSGDLSDLSVVLPDDLPSGAHRLVVVGRLSGRTSTSVVYVRSHAPWITLPDGALRPRQTFGLILGGFSPGERVSVTIEPAKPPSGTPTPTGPPTVFGTLTTDPSGNSVWTQLKIPVKTAGKYSIVARGLQSGLQAHKDVDLQPYSPLLDLSPWSGPPGVAIALNARGFEPGETIRIYLGAAAVAAGQTTADKYGNAWGAGNVKVPYGTLPGPLTVKLVGDDSGATVTRSFSVQQIKPWLQLSIYWGAPTAPVNLSGGGWYGGEAVTIHLGSAQGPALVQARADDYGWLHDTPPVYIPQGASNKVVFVAVGTQSHAVATASFQVVYPFGLGPTPVPTPNAGQATG
ncbi:MAG TPA: hypothetical protein VFZ25_08265 [Chloroflexota bacterium]|nr:hypothetical protein [Chloroflexota bacterium]